jgi:hypothetical protein
MDHQRPGNANRRGKKLTGFHMGTRTVSVHEYVNALPPAGIGNLLPKKILADLRNRRNEFRIIVKKQAEANEAAWTSARNQLEADWGRFDRSSRIRRKFRRTNKPTGGDFQASGRGPIEGPA